ncbi:MAG: MMPL family transporter [Acidimicrobiales bacterium]
MFARLGRWCHDHRWKVIIFWVAALFLGNGILAGAGGAQTNADFSLPGFESAKGVEILEDSFGGQGSGTSGSIVFQVDQGIDDPKVQETMEGFFEDVDKVDGIVRVGSPYAEGGERQVANKDPYTGKIAFAQVDMDPNMDEADYTKAATDVRKVYDDFVDTAEDQGIRVELGGQALAEFEAPVTEALGVAFAIVILILAFGSVLAMGLPIGLAIAGIALGSTIAGFLSFIVHPPSFASIFGVMIGLGVGIDYALFIVTRYRENRHKGHDTRDSVGIAIDTAGRAVLFAGTTVVISLLGMVVMGLSFVTGMAVAIATVVAATMLASVTLLPALLGFAGGNVEVTRYRGLIAAGFVAVALVGVGLAIPALFLVGMLFAVLTIALGFALAPLKKEVERKTQSDLRQSAAYRWSRVIQHRPWPAAIGAVIVLGILATPLLSLRLGASDESNFPEDTTTRQAYELIADGFGVGYNSQLVVVSKLGSDVSESSLDQVTQAIRDTDGVDFVSDPQISDHEDAVLWQIYPATAPQDDGTTDLVKGLRDNVIPAATEGTGLDAMVSGAVAINVDFSSYLAERLPYFLAAVLVLSFLLLMAVFRSLLVPLKAVIMNLLSIGAAYGVMVAGFQWGWLGGLLNFDSVPIEPWMPMMLFAIVFGLSMDYEVFLLSRVREEWLRTGDSRTSVADGLAATARVITAAALIMVFVFGAFLLEDQTVVKLMGVGLATAVFLDATVVRMLLVPATMELLGDKNWWLPKWLDRLLPNIDVEGGHTELPVDEPDRQPEPAGV